VALAAASCTSQRPATVDFSETPREYRAKDYGAAYERWTRHDVIRWDYVDAALEVWATFKSWDFREAYVEHYAGIYVLSEADKATLRAAQLETSRNTYEFHITAQSARYSWNDLEKRNSPWRVSLIDGLGHELTPDSLRLEKLPNAYEIEFFPAKTPFSRSYLVRFSKAPPPGPSPAPGQAAGQAASGENEFFGTRSGSLTLRIASPLGRTDLVWQGS